jgi:hypothetical protein
MYSTYEAVSGSVTLVQLDNLNCSLETSGLFAGIFIAYYTSGLFKNKEN